MIPGSSMYLLRAAAGSPFHVEWWCKLWYGRVSGMNGAMRQVVKKPAVPELFSLYMDEWYGG